MISPRWLRSTEPLELTSFEQPLADSETIVDINSIASNTHPRVKPTDQNTKCSENPCSNKLVRHLTFCHKKIGQELAAFFYYESSIGLVVK